MTDELTAEPEKGFVFATTGESYTILARRAARSLRAVMPRAAIDLFTDQAVDDVVFDQIHGLAHNGHRPKMEALRRSRFARTIYLDADVMVLTDISEVFDLLDGYDLAAALGGNRSQQMVPPDDGLPRAFPVVNSGVIAARSSPRLAAFLTE
ncbi:hypothetical protein [Sinisalibacter lacisalsi]|uniref:Nucleotide-diphospho-sugar transferase domain-containing protein n=1 Tax=Sinisalibacter lacisalsi TaxID=1526570 RepID=A0ABQ1QF49_9RHOB|nr:hypothetical protein [Sinisalibacter lacisalsi]GGD25642.1 hypothetical protein GCM10011358_07660 [Sinisalibacter lacisalsi]